MSNTHAVHRPRPRAQAKTKASQAQRDARILKERGCAIGRIQRAMYDNAFEISSNSVDRDELVRMLDSVRVIPHGVLRQHHVRLEAIREIVTGMIDGGDIVVGESGGFHLSSGLTQYQKNVAEHEQKAREAQAAAQFRKESGRRVIDSTAPDFLGWSATNAAELALQ